MFWIVLKNARGEKKKVRPGDNFGKDWTPTGEIERDGVSLSEEQRGAGQLIAEIERELSGEDGTPWGDWIKHLAAPIAKLLGKQDCMACEARRVMLNAAAALKRKHGEQEGKRILKSLLIRSYREPEEKILSELKRHLE